MTAVVQHGLVTYWGGALVWIDGYLFEKNWFMPNLVSVQQDPSAMLRMTANL